MTHNSRLAVSVHALAYLAHKGGQAVTSPELAGSVGTNPVVIRRLLSALKAARLVTAQKGSSGGFLLASTPENITLLDIYRAVEPKGEQGLKRFDPSKNCPVGGKIVAVLESAFFKAQAGMEAELQKITLAEVGRHLRGVCPNAA
jgi:Rrf2 family protein